MATQTPNMSLYLPTIGVDTGLTWEQDVNANTSILDSHNHANGSGLQINPNGININSPLVFNGQSASQVKSTQYLSQTSPLTSGADFYSTYFSGFDFYVTDGHGNAVQITSGGNVNATSSGISSGTATASFVASTLVVNAASNTPANIQAASFLLGNTGVSGSKYVTLSPPSALAINYSLVLPSLPASTQSVLIDTSGNMNPGFIDYAQLATAVAQALNPPGTIITFAGPTAPAGYLYCDGSAVSRTTYANLFAAIGVFWGYGDNVTTFNLPETRGLFLRGQGGVYDPNVGSRTSIQPGGGAGNQVGSWQQYATSTSGVSVNDPGHHHTVNTIQFNGATTVIATASASTTVTQNTSTSTTGITLSGASETRPVNAYVMYCIKY